MSLAFCLIATFGAAVVSVIPPISIIIYQDKHK